MISNSSLNSHVYWDTLFKNQFFLKDNTNIFDHTFEQFIIKGQIFGKFAIKELHFATNSNFRISPLQPGGFKL